MVEADARNSQALRHVDCRSVTQVEQHAIGFIHMNDVGVKRFDRLHQRRVGGIANVALEGDAHEGFAL